MSSTVVLGRNALALKAHLETLTVPTATVEAEYGSECVEGSLLTFAHHGERSSNPAPCEMPNQSLAVDKLAIGVSHLDLDTLGGIMAIRGIKPECESFWQLAAFVDVNGPHKIGMYDGGSEDVELLNAWWAWSDKNKDISRPRFEDGLVIVDVTTNVDIMCSALTDILVRRTEHLITAGHEWVQAQKNLNEESYVESHAGVTVRVHSEFVNHLYVNPDGTVVKAVVGFNTKTGGITLSLADPVDGVDCAQIMQDLLGPEAGGHAGIAGSPRNKRLGTREVMGVAYEIASQLDPAALQHQHDCSTCDKVAMCQQQPAIDYREENGIEYQENPVVGLLNALRARAENDPDHGTMVLELPGGMDEVALNPDLADTLMQGAAMISESGLGDETTPANDDELGVQPEETTAEPETADVGSGDTSEDTLSE